MIDQLIWKDFRNQRPVLLLGVFFLLGPYIGFLIMFGWINPAAPEQKELLAYLSVAVCMSAVLSQITMLVMGASIIGSERQDRGMEFLLTLPPTRAKILMGKLIFCSIVAAVIWGTFLLGSEVLVRLFVPDLSEPTRQTGLGAAMVGVVFFGVAWLTSVYAKGVVFPILAALSVTVSILFAVLKYSYIQEWGFDDYNKYFGAMLYSAYGTIGLASLVVGWIVFNRRFEP